MAEENTGDAPQPHRLHPISVPGFEGPLDLLLSFIEEERLDITGISLATVTDQYLSRMKELNDLPPEHLADFLVVAATLLLIKSKRLFPDLPLTGDEEQQVASLEWQLKEYRRFREAAKKLLGLWNRGTRLHARASFVGLTATFYPPAGVGVPELRTALEHVCNHLPKFEILAQEVVRRVVSIEERIRDIHARIGEHMHLTFHEVAKAAASKVELIVSFLALLELVKQRLVIAEQASAFRDILVRQSDDHADSNNA